MKNAFLFVMCTLVALTARDAAAQVGQQWTDRGYLNLNVGFDSMSGDLADATTFTIYDESGTLSISQPIDSGWGPLFDLSAGARVWQNVSAGLAFHRGSGHSDATVQGSIPHPAIFSTPGNDHTRPVALSVGDLKRTERAIDLQIGYMLLLSDRLDVHLTLGPSFFKLRQDTVSEVTISEGPGNATVNAATTVAERTDSATGFNIGADVGYKLLSSGPMKVGVGMFLRYSGATANVELIRFAGASQGNVVDSKVGGVQIGFGGRLRF